MPPKPKSPTGKGGKASPERRGKSATGGRRPQSAKDREDDDKKKEATPFDWDEYMKGAYHKALSAIMVTDGMRVRYEREPNTMDEKSESAKKERNAVLSCWTDMEKLECERRERMADSVHPGKYHPACKHVRCDAENGKCCSNCSRLSPDAPRNSEELYFDVRNAHWSCCGNKDRYITSCPMRKVDITT
mmetsp:Transcript_43855/g.73088  ORF Transcript_43855/g.73088 Transcript_43855/m.73088 type:complete len:189 (-) Transcript_43855:184-750(-)|eukprot:CAMPEP_0184339950 /NCGR_PEP_ID=MMETSP1089-20130417/8629_1 /TAXON_ID=38269 ORGANISM="Gloeochaete wittrockiana, Strain SAG46.84" /NCGR_SAMPLE_ID=MMETSP1089 /ASSEMBLY_ACC=CAM_ASM_000445 /LENGTH=188 /DNA_ID=CAMNT_0026667499 /DNA_START=24 /DNA_END=590 /DNA_ORIENTATION=-